MFEKRRKGTREGSYKGMEGKKKEGEGKIKNHERGRTDRLKKEKNEQKQISKENKQMKKSVCVCVWGSSIQSKENVKNIEELGGGVPRLLGMSVTLEHLAVNNTSKLKEEGFH